MCEHCCYCDLDAGYACMSCVVGCPHVWEMEVVQLHAVGVAEEVPF